MIVNLGSKQKKISGQRVKYWRYCHSQISVNPRFSGLNQQVGARKRI